MQKRHLDRAMYFKELAITCEKYYIPYISNYKAISPNLSVLEVGCGDGGNLLPFAKLGCKVIGVDIAECRINDAASFFEENKVQGDFIAADIFKINSFDNQFDIIICHDVIEHIADKTQFILRLKSFLSNTGIIFIAFPAWQMPFGGHQQIVKNKFLSHLPFVHLLPSFLYKAILRLFKEDKNTITELLNIKQTRCSIEKFLKILEQTNCCIVNQQFYFINPHYEIKFSLKPKKLSPLISKIPYLRNFFATSCFYIVKKV